MMRSDPDELMSKAEQLSKRLRRTWKADMQKAADLYEQAAKGFRDAKNYARAKEAYEKAAGSILEMRSSPWDAAKHMESAAGLAKDLRKWDEVRSLYRRASELYNNCGTLLCASNALAEGARALKDPMPEEALQLYTNAYMILELHGFEEMAFDHYLGAANVYVKLEKYTDAASVLMRLGSKAGESNAARAQRMRKAYLGAIIVHLYAHDFNQAKKCYNDCYRTNAFFESDQDRCATKLLAAYWEGDVEEIKRFANSDTVSNLDPVIIGLARKLPTGDVSAMNVDAANEEGEEPLDENDLT